MSKQHEQDMSWSDVYWSWKQRGYPPEEAAHQADEFMRRRYREMEGDLQRTARRMKK